jgi:ABC-type lipoprotein export system ATPase subunit
MIERVVIRGYRCFKLLDFEPNARLNIVVGDNEAGKSTLLEAIGLALTGRSNGRWAGEELNPFWFYRPAVLEYFQHFGTDRAAAPPELSIELFLNGDDDLLQPMRGVHNSLDIDAPGIALRAFPATEYGTEFDAYMRSEPPLVLPVEFYAVEWRDFSFDQVVRRPKFLSTSFIDSRTVRSTSGIDFHTRQMLGDHLDQAERMEISIAHRRSRQQITEETLGAINERIAKESESLHHRSLGLQMDQSARASWEAGIVPQVDDIPFAMSGLGQQAAIKVALAMSRTAGVSAFVLIEEPENHLSHTSLARLVGRISTLQSAGQQLFISTHSSYVLNRLGIDTMMLIHDGKLAALDALSPETIGYFRKLAGYDTLRLVLARKVVLVEGPSDAIVFTRCFKDVTGTSPMEAGVDVISMNGLTFRRALELCKSLDREVVALRDNDDADPDELRADLGDLLESPKRQMLIGERAAGPTLEPQLLAANTDATLRAVLGLKDDQDVLAWMKRNKAEGALRIHDSTTQITYPAYIAAAVELVK